MEGNSFAYNVGRKEKENRTMANIFNVARYVLNQCGPLCIWKLQKLCYYSQAWSLAWTGQPLFPEDFEAWSNGPVCPELLPVHQGHFVLTASDIPVALESEPGLTLEQMNSIDCVLAEYGSMEPYELREQTHSEKPWQDARGNLPDGAKCQNVLSKTAIQKYYGSL